MFVWLDTFLKEPGIQNKHSWFPLGSFNNYVERKGWAGGRQNVYICRRWEGRWSGQCLRKQKVEEFCNSECAYLIFEVNGIVIFFWGSSIIVFISTQNACNTTTKTFNVHFLMKKVGTYYILPFLRGGGQPHFFMYLCRYRVVGGGANMYVCLQKVGRWSKKDKIMST